MAKRKKAKQAGMPSAPPETPVAAARATGDGARLPVLAVLLGGLWLLLNAGGGSDLAKAPPLLFAAAWWTLALLGALQIRRAGYLLWDRLSSPLRGFLLALTCVAFLNIAAAATYADAGHLAPVAYFGWLQWGGGILSGVVLAVWLGKDLRGLAPVILQTLLILGALVAIHGLLEYIQAGGTEHLRGIFAWHNPAGGYFAMLLPIAVARVLCERRAQSLLLYSLLALLFGAALFATNSRGAWLTGFIGLLWLGGLLLVRGLAVRWRLGLVAGALVLAIAAPFVIGGPLAPIRDRLVSFTAQDDFSVGGRTHFYSTAWTLFSEGPYDRGMALLGTGMNTYRYLAPRVQEDPRFYASDPHSTLFQWLVELGLFGVLAYLLAWGWWGWIQGGSGLFNPPDPEAEPVLWDGARIDLAGIMAGLGAGWLHWTIDFDSTYWLITWTAIVLMVLVIAALRARSGKSIVVALPVAGVRAATGDPQSGEGGLSEWKLSSALSGVLMLVLWLSTIACWTFAISRVFYDIGHDEFTRYQATEDVDYLASAETKYTLSLMFWPWNPDSFHGLSVTQLWLARAAGARDRDAAGVYVLKARESASEAVRLGAYNANNWYNLAQMDWQLFQLGLKDQATTANDMQTTLITAIERDRLNNPKYYFMLTQALALSPPDEFRDQAIIQNMERLMHYYPPAEITEFSKTRLDWQHLPMSYLQHWPYYLMALKAVGNEAGLQVAKRIAREDLIPAAMRDEYAPKEMRQRLVSLSQRIVDEIDTAEGGILSPEIFAALQGAPLPGEDEFREELEAGEPEE